MALLAETDQPNGSETLRLAHLLSATGHEGDERAERTAGAAGPVFAARHRPARYRPHDDGRCYRVPAWVQAAGPAGLTGVLLTPPRVLLVLCQPVSGTGGR